MADTDQIMARVTALINGTVKDRAQTRLDNIKTQKLPEDEYNAAIDDSKKQTEDEKYLIEWDEIPVFYEAFKLQSLQMNPKVKPYQIDKMFLEFFQAMYLTKLKIYDTVNEGDIAKRAGDIQNIPFQGAQPRVVWTPAHEAASNELRHKMEEIFKPLAFQYEKQRTKLFTGNAGRSRANKLRQEPGSEWIMDNPIMHVFGNVETVFFSDSHCQQPDSCETGQLDIPLWVIMRNATSGQYVVNSNGEVDVFLEKGEITLSSIFWNSELAILRTMANEGKINLTMKYYKLTNDANDKISLLVNQIKDKDVQYQALYAMPNSPDKDKNLTELEDQLNDLSDQIDALAESDNSWVEVPFNDLTFKGLKKGPEGLAVQDVLKVANKMKSFIKSKQEPKPPGVESKAANIKKLGPKP